MSPTLSDDTLVRELTERVDRAVPAMALDPVGVLAAGRRHRRQRIALRSSAGLVIAAVAVVGTAQVWHGPVPGPTDQGPQPTAEPRTVELAPGVIAVSLPSELTLDDGTAAVDLGISFPYAAATSRPLLLLPITNDQLAEANASAEPHRAWDGGVQLAQVGESGLEPVSTPWVWSSAGTADDEESRWDSVMRTLGEESGLFVGVLPAWLPDPRVVFYSQDGFLQADGSRVHSLEVPVYAAPTDDVRLLYTVWIPAVADGVDGFLTDIDATLAIGSDGRVVGGQRCAGMTLDECAGVFGPDIYAAAGLLIETAADVRAVETDDGPAVDLGVQVGDDWDPLDQGLTYALRAGALVDEESRTPDKPGLWLITLAPDGSTVTGGGGSVDEALIPANRNPIWMSMLGDHEACQIGVRPPALEGATFDLIIERDTGKQVVPIPTFRVPGLDADVWFVALRDPDVDIRDWPPTSIRVTYPDGKTASWSLGALAQANP